MNKHSKKIYLSLTYYQKIMNIKIWPDESNQRLDRFMRKYMKPFPHVGLATIFGWIRKWIIKVNENKKDWDYKVRLWDNIYIHHCDDTAFFLEKKVDLDSVREQKKVIFSKPQIQKMIIFEDKNWIWFDKPIWVNIHEGNHSRKDTNMNDVLAKHLWFDYKNNEDNTKSETFKPSFCFRLDKDTSGILIAAKNYESLKYLNNKIQQRDEITKIYICVVLGKIDKQITIDEPLFKWFTEKFARAKSFVNHDKWLSAKSVVTPIANIYHKILGDLSLVNVQIHTGRFHQIRNHMSHVWNPILGDKLYGDEGKNKLLKSNYKTDRQLLHSLYYGFDDINGKYIYKISKYPDDFANIFDNKHIQDFLSKLKSL